MTKQLAVQCNFALQKFKALPDPIKIKLNADVNSGDANQMIATATAIAGLAETNTGELYRYAQDSGVSPEHIIKKRLPLVNALVEHFNKKGLLDGKDDLGVNLISLDNLP